MATPLDISTGQQSFAEQAAQQETPKHYHSTEIRVCELEDSETTRCIIFAATLIQLGDGQLVEGEKRAIGFEENCVDLVPGEAVRVGTKGMESIEEPGIKYRHLQGAIDL
ncbi:MAG: hypothetical protein L6R36_004078 [Xanthoria steineri]|nr:MAG: hypothetical protein L6R36_004078 [Xanthoria steineri]